MVLKSLFLFGLVLVCALRGSLGEGYRRVCYYTNWSQYRNGLGKFLPADIDPDLCTHLVYAFADLPMTTYELTPREPNDIDFYRQFQDLKSSNPALKTLLAIGGWNAGSVRFSNLALTESHRQNFAVTSVEFLRRHGFDGLDLDWEYPTDRGGRPEDKENFVLLLKELMSEFEREAEETDRERLLLTAAVSAGKYAIDNGYNVAEISKYLDFINLMSYDLHGAWESTAGHNSPLFQRSGEYGAQTFLNMAWAAEYWIDQGAPAHKLVIGLANYGRGFRLSNPSVHEPGSATSGPSIPGRYTQESGVYAYYEICNLEGTHYWMDDSMVPYLVTNDGHWIGYDDEESFFIKLNWIKSQNYGGAMVWALDFDDFKMSCKNSSVPYPLTSLMKVVLDSDEPPATLKPRTPATTSTGATGSPDTSTGTMTDVPQEEFTCDGKIGRFHPDLVNCNMYYQCVNGIKYHSTCQPGLLWGQGCHCCDYPERVTCGQVTSGTVTPGTSQAPITTDSSADTGYKRVCYYSNWSQHRPGIGAFVPENIDPFLCTHLVYAFAEMPFETYELTTLERNDLELYARVQSLKAVNPSLKTLLAVGGWTAGSLRFSNMVSNYEFRQKFVRTSVTFLRQHGFDGLDLDWEYPTLRGGLYTDKQNFVWLLQELLQAFREEAEETGRARLLLTAAVPAGKWAIDSGYNVTEIQKYLDFINIMTYDLHGAWDRSTGHNSPLFSRAGESGGNEFLNIEWAADYWHKQGTPKEKLIIGLATYGRGFVLASPSLYQPGSPASGPSPAGRITGSPGFYAYYEICEMAGTRYWMEESMVPYFVTTDGVWIGYDDEESFTIKLNWIKQQKYGGAMIWSLPLDDFGGNCNLSTRPYPLTSLLRDILPSSSTPITTIQPITSTSRDTTVQPITTTSTSRDTTSTRQTTTQVEVTTSTLQTTTPPLTTDKSTTSATTTTSSTSATTTKSTTAPTTTTTSTTTPTTSASMSTTRQTTVEVTTVSDNDFCRTKENGYYAHRTDCFKFFNCYNGRSYISPCPPGTAFSAERKLCDHVGNVDCARET